MSSGNYLKMRTINKFDGSVWRQFESPEHIFLLTSLGRRLLKREDVRQTIGLYAEDYREGQEGPDKTRSFVAQGRRARVFSLGPDLVIKEALPEIEPLEFFASISRMDRLIDAVQKNCPRWIDIPGHYGALTSKSDLSKQFLLMQKVDHGVTVGDILISKSRIEAGELEASSMDKFGSITPQIKEEVEDRFKQMKGYLRKALLAEYLSPDEFLPDIDNNPYNIVVEKLDTPIADSHMRYWVIDQ